MKTRTAMRTNALLSLLRRGRLLAGVRWLAGNGADTADVRRRIFLVCDHFRPLTSAATVHGSWGAMHDQSSGWSPH